jgi:urease accessory protein
MTASLLLLTDGRLPSGAHAHSGGLEPVARWGLVRDVSTLAAFLQGRLWTVGLVTASLAGAATRSRRPAENDLRRLQGEADARMPSPAAREASRRQGRQLLRAAKAAWPSPRYDDLPSHPHYPLVLGVAAVAAGLDPIDAALAAAHGSVTGPAGAAVRLLSLDPLAVAAALARLAPEVDAVAAEAVAADEIPAVTAPLLEVGAEDHATWEVRLFAS